MTFSCPFSKRREFSSANASRVNFDANAPAFDVAFGIVLIATNEIDCILVVGSCSFDDFLLTRRAMSTRPNAPLAMSGLTSAEDLPLISTTDELE